MQKPIRLIEPRRQIIRNPPVPAFAWHLTTLYKKRTIPLHVARVHTRTTLTFTLARDV